MASNLGLLRDKLIENGYDVARVSKAVAYLSDSKNSFTVDKHNGAELYSLVVKYLNAGTNLDGVNVILSGKNMGLITFHGFMNKVKANHPNVFFDVQLVREGDEFKFAKESGSVVYTHNIGDPFNDNKIVGAYCVVKLNNGSGDESLELLNSVDFQKMKDSSRNPDTWNKWESEFWRKSVIKRACKVYFAEEIEQLEKIDNADYGLKDSLNETDDVSDEAKQAILDAYKESKK